MQANKNLEERADDEKGWSLPGAGWMKGAVVRLKGYGPAGGVTCHGGEPLLQPWHLCVMVKARRSGWVALVTTVLLDRSRRPLMLYEYIHSRVGRCDKKYADWYGVPVAIYMG